jgi:hypothetical protein
MKNGFRHPDGMKWASMGGSMNILLDQSIEALTKPMGERPVGYRAPSWAMGSFNDESGETAGFLYDGRRPHYTGHRSRVLWLEKLIVYMKSKPGVWFATHEEVAQYLKKTFK